MAITRSNWAQAGRVCPGFSDGAKKHVSCVTTFVQPPVWQQIVVSATPVYAKLILVKPAKGLLLGSTHRLQLKADIQYEPPAYNHLKPNRTYTTYLATTYDAWFFFSREPVKQLQWHCCFSAYSRCCTMRLFACGVIWKRSLGWSPEDL